MAGKRKKTSSGDSAASRKRARERIAKLRKQRPGAVERREGKGKKVRAARKVRAAAQSEQRRADKGKGNRKKIKFSVKLKPLEDARKRRDQRIKEATEGKRRKRK